MTHFPVSNQLEVIRNDADAATSLLKKEFEEKIDLLKKHAQSSEKRIQELNSALLESQNATKELKTKHEGVLESLEEAMSEKKELNAENLHLKVGNVDKLIPQNKFYSASCPTGPCLHQFNIKMNK